MNQSNPILFVLLKATTKDPFGRARNLARCGPSEAMGTLSPRYKRGSEPPANNAPGVSGEFGVSGGVESRHAPLGLGSPLRRIPRSRSSDRPTHTIQFSAVPVLDKARGSTADTKANPPSRKSESSVRFNGILAATEPRAARHAQAHADRLSDFQLEAILTKV